MIEKVKVVNVDSQTDRQTKQVVLMNSWSVSTKQMDGWTDRKTDKWDCVSNWQLSTKFLYGTLRQTENCVLPMSNAMYILFSGAPEWKDDSDPIRMESVKMPLENSELKLSCPSKGRPRPDTVWYKNGEPYFSKSERVWCSQWNCKMATA